MTVRTRVKLCGICNIEDAKEGVKVGVDALGFIFVEKSPRNVKPDEVRKIISKLPPFVDFVGVFVDQDLKEVEEIVEYCGLSYAQLHGNEDPKFCERLARISAPCQVVKAFRIGEEANIGDFAPYNNVVKGFLLDTYTKGLAGGTGEIFDWQIVKKLKLEKPMILAGGLNEDNILEAICTLRPFGVDVNSGVESAPGQKDYKKLHLLMDEVRAADAGC